MATAEEIGKYVIQPLADALLSELSNEFADLIISIATQMTTEKDAHGVPVLTVCVISSASEFLCHAIQEGVKQNKIGLADAEPILGKLRTFCDKVSKECANDVRRTTPHG